MGQGDYKTITESNIVWNGDYCKFTGDNVIINGDYNHSYGKNCIINGDYNHNHGSATMTGDYNHDTSKHMKGIVSTNDNYSKAFGQNFNFIPCIGKNNTVGSIGNNQRIVNNSWLHTLGGGGGILLLMMMEMVYI